jgi:hypothetical protein
MRETIEVNITLSRWLICVVGCCIWVFKKKSELKLSVNRYAGSVGNLSFISVRAWCIAVNSARRMFWSPCNNLEIAKKNYRIKNAITRGFSGPKTVLL